MGQTSSVQTGARYAIIHVINTWLLYVCKGYTTDQWDWPWNQVVSSTGSCRGTSQRLNRPREILDHRTHYEEANRHWTRPINVNKFLSAQLLLGKRKVHQLTQVLLRLPDMFYLPLERIDVIPDKHREAREAHVLYSIISFNIYIVQKRGQLTFVLYL